jgi:hypothetical protein
MRRFEDPRSILRDRIIGHDAQLVIDAEFREIHPTQTPARRGSPLAALKGWCGQLFSGRTRLFGSPRTRQ